MASNRGGSESVFFNSAIQAADSTTTGWTAKSSPPSHARRSPSFRSSRQTSSAPSRCRPTLVRWYPVVELSRHSCHCAHCTVALSGR